MQRRDIFNLFLKGISTNAPVSIKPDPVLDLSSYFRQDETIAMEQVWEGTEYMDCIKPEISTAYAFTICINFNHADLVASVLQLGIKDGTQSSGIELGYHGSGQLFIDQTTDHRTLPIEKLKEGFQLVLTVNPLKNGMTHAKLKAIDNAGLTLSIVKTDKIKTSDWEGDINLSTLKFNSLRMQGHKSIKNYL
ncbi:hypothetical protein [Pedobacter immunditicola]|uniref:hypothetical protein n=1 Tax=Pedobacter immunditicola TaxID=3133440 RepID=UPI00309C1C4C